MPSDAPLDNLVRIGQLKREPPERDEGAVTQNASGRFLSFPDR